MQYPERPGKLVHPALSFPVRATLSCQEFTLGASQCLPGGWNNEEWEAMCTYFQDFDYTPLLNFLKWILSSSSDISVLGYLSNYSSCRGTEAGVSHCDIMVISCISHFQVFQIVGVKGNSL